MRKLFLFIIPILFPALCSAQEELDVRRDPIRVGLTFSMDIVDREVRSASGTNAHENILYERDGYRSSRIGYTAGMDLLIPFSINVSLQTGLRYADRGFRSRGFSDYIARDPIELDPAIPTNVTYGNHFQYIELPLLVRFQFGDRRLRPSIAAGITPSFLLGVYRVIYEEIPEGPNETQRAEDLFAFNNFNLFPTLGLGLIHHATDRIWTQLEIAGSYGVLPITDPPARGKLWNAGVVLGVFYSLRTS